MLFLLRLIGVAEASNEPTRIESLNIEIKVLVKIVVVKIGVIVDIGRGRF